MFGKDDKPTIGGDVGGGDSTPAPEEEGPAMLGAGEDAAARSVMKALKAGDTAGFKAALKDFGAACGWSVEAAE